MKKVLITGAANGLGFCVATLHVNRGDETFALDSSITQEIKDLANKNDNLRVIFADITSTEIVKNAIKKIEEYTHKLDIIYNIAGIYSFASRVTITETDWDQEALKMLDVNALGPMRIIKESFPLLRQGSTIINISSEAASLTDCRRKNEYAYCMSKTALNMASRILNNYVSDKGIRVICVHPGWMKTKMGAQLNNMILKLDLFLKMKNLRKCRLNRWLVQERLYQFQMTFKIYLKIICFLIIIEIL